MNVLALVNTLAIKSQSLLRRKQQQDISSSCSAPQNGRPKLIEGKKGKNSIIAGTIKTNANKWRE